MANWDVRFMHLAEFVAEWSKDRSAKVGCAIVGPDHEVVALGYNGFPRGCNDDREERHQRPLKYQWTEHAERNAVFNAARSGASLKGCTAYIPWYPCADCARSLIQSGVTTIVAVEPNWNDERWGSDFRVVKDMLDECKVEVRWFPEAQLRNGPVYTVREPEVLEEAFKAMQDFLYDIPLAELEEEGLIEDPDFKHLVERVRILSRYVPAIAKGHSESYKLVLALFPVNREKAMDAVDQVASENKVPGPLD